MAVFSESFKWIAGFSLVAALVNSIGIYAIFKYREWAERMQTFFICFAAGVLITTPLTLALPNAITKNPNAGFVALLGFLFMLLSNHAIQHITKKKTTAFGITAAQGIGIHSLVDGMVYTVTFSVSILTGILAGTGLVIHEFAEGVITYLVLVNGNVENKKAAVYSFFIAALTTPIGAFVAYPFIRSLSKSHLGLMLGFVSGVLLYVSAAHLLPEAREDEKVHSMVSFLGGVGLALLIVFLQTA